MAREKKKAPAPTRGIQAVTRRAKMERAQHYQDRIWMNLNPLKEPPKVKHKTYFESVENTNKKKKLEFQIMTDRHPPPGFEFVPTGHPELSQTCKELSREQDAMIFIVSDSRDPDLLEHHMNRAGYHFRQPIVDQAREILKQKGHRDYAAKTRRPGEPEPIPHSQQEINREADAVLRDLFPRIPNTDRHEIIQHAFQKDGKFNGESKVGMAKELTLARRVQLAALAHIRHTHTRYDELLKESDWANARKAVEKPCLDIIVKWRGDEETGRDQLDEILREVIEISDTESDSEDESSGAEDVRMRQPRARPVVDQGVLQRLSHPSPQSTANGHRNHSTPIGNITPPRQRIITRAERRTARKTQQRFRRYAAAAQALAGSSHQNDPNSGSMVSDLAPVAIDLTRHQGSSHPISSEREPLVAMNHRTPNPGQFQERIDTRTESPRYPSGYHRERTVVLPPGLAEPHSLDTSPQFIRMSDSHRPKVGLPRTSHHSETSVSPVRAGLQDMLLPSIEPASPDIYRGPQHASQILHRESRQFTEVPRVVTRTIVEPGVSIPGPHSPGAMISGDEMAAKRRRVVPYSHRDFDSQPSSSFVRVNPQARDEDIRRAPFEYLSDRPLASPRVSDNTVPQHRAWAMPREVPSANRGDGPLRTRTNPILIDRDDDYQPRRVVEVRGPPTYGNYEPLSPRRGEILREFSVRGDPRTQVAPRVIYVDEPVPRARDASDHYQNGFSHSGYGPDPRQGQQHHIHSDDPHRRMVGIHPDYHSSHFRDTTRDDQQVRNPVEWPGNVPRATPAVPRGPERLETRYEAHQNGFREHSNFAPTSQPHRELRQPEGFHNGLPATQEPIHQTYGGPQYIRIRAADATVAEMDYRHDDQRPFPVNPGRTGYPEPYGPAHCHIPERRNVIWVDH
ncbi:hypothetical protein F4775DRAFT_585154 [Biscogniauxia sp. FL1348]|nr:hypothetical protein F4775DRAFT_585154 [Biscogniauxia sp. FL1348]